MFMHLDNKPESPFDLIHKNLKDMMSASTQINFQIEKPELLQNQLIALMKFDKK